PSPPGAPRARLIPPRYRQVPSVAGRPAGARGGTLELQLAERPPARSIPALEVTMPALTRFVLRHKALVALFWVVVAAVGVMTISGTTHRMTNDFSMPGQAFKVDNQIVSQYGNGGSQAPYLPVITVPAGQKVTDPAGAAATRRAVGAPARAVRGVGVAG